MTRRWLAILALSALLPAGCVQRRFVIESDPPGAMVLVNNRPLGATPVDGGFLYYGTYHFTILKDGYEPLHVNQPIDAPVYQYFPLDFVSENVYPGKIEDVRRFRYQLQPKVQPQTDELIQKANQLRDRGRAIPPTVETP